MHCAEILGSSLAPANLLGAAPPAKQCIVRKSRTAALLHPRSPQRRGSEKHSFTHLHGSIYSIAISDFRQFYSYRNLRIDYEVRQPFNQNLFAVEGRLFQNSSQRYLHCLGSHSSLNFTTIFFREEALVINLLDLWIAGQETTTTTILSGLINLINYPEVEFMNIPDYFNMQSIKRSTILSSADVFPDKWISRSYQRIFYSFWNKKDAKTEAQQILSILATLILHVSCKKLMGFPTAFISYDGRAKLG